MQQELHISWKEHTGEQVGRQGCLGLFSPQVTVLLVLKAVGQKKQPDKETRRTCMPVNVQGPSPLEVQRDL